MAQPREAQVTALTLCCTFPHVSVQDSSTACRPNQDFCVSDQFQHAVKGHGLQLQASNRQHPDTHLPRLA